MRSYLGHKKTRFFLIALFLASSLFRPTFFQNHYLASFSGLSGRDLGVIVRVLGNSGKIMPIIKTLFSNDADEDAIEGSVQAGFAHTIYFMLCFI